MTKRKNIEHDLQSRDEQYKTLVENMNEGIIRFKVDEEIEFVNKRFCQIVGYKERELIGKIGHKLLVANKESLKIVNEAISQRKKGKSTKYETQLKKKSGELIWITMHGSPLYDDAGKYVGSFGIVSDITESKKYQEELTSSEQRFKDLSNATFEAIVIHHNGKIIEVNESYCKMFGYKRKEVIGEKVTKFGAPEIRDLLIDKAIRKDERPYEARGMRKDGSTFEVEVCGRTSSFGGKEVRVAAIHDITEKKKIEEKQKESEERFRSLFENANDLIQSVTPDGKFLYVNNSWLKTLGYKRSEVSELTMFDIIHESSMQHCMELFKKVMGGKNVKGIDATFVAKNGELIEVQGSVFVRELGDGAIATQGIFRNVSEEKRVELALRESEAQYRTLVEKMNEGIIVVDTEEIILYVNARFCEIVGYSEKELLGVYGPDKLLADKESKKRIEGAMEQRKKGISSKYEVQFERKNKEWIWASMNGTPLYDDGGNITGSMGIVTDITEAKAANETLEQRVIERTKKLQKEIEERKRAVERHKSLVETLTYGVEDIDAKGKIIFANSALHRIYGYKNGELIGRSIFDFVATDAERQYLRKYVKMLVKEKPKQVPYYGKKKTKQGKVIDVVVDWNYKFDENRRVIGFISVITDITEKKRAENALRDSEAQFRSLSENAPVIITTLDRQGNIHYTNRLQKGFKMKEMIGSSVYNFIYPDARKTYRQHLNTTFKTGVVSSFEVQGYVENNDIGWFSNRMAPIKSDGKVNTVVLITLDITESKTAEIRIKESEGKYRRLVETMNEGVIQVDNDDRIVFVNGRICEMCGYSEEDLIGKYAYKVLLPTRSKKEVTKIARDRKKGISSQYEIQVKIKSGELKWFLIDGAPVYDVNRKIIGSVGVHLDITHRKRIEEELYKSLKEKEILFREVHHRVKNNLQIVSSLLNLHATSIGDEQISGIFQESQDRIHTMAFIHESLYLKESLSEINVREYLGPLVKQRVKASADMRDKLKLVINLPDVSFKIDTMLPLGLLLNELVTNSLKHAFPDHKKGTISVMLKSKGRSAYTFYYSDDGIGFSQKDKERKAESIGLVLIDSFVMQLDGKMKMPSKGKGAQYVVDFKVG